MKRLGTLAFAIVAVALGSYGPVSAEHMTLVEPSAASPDSKTLDVEIKVGKDGFRLGGRLLGPGGVAGAWLNGQIRPDGLALDGRVQNESGRAYKFKLDAEVLDWLIRGAWPWLLSRPSAE
jgi:hypothetical protein